MRLVRRVKRPFRVGSLFKMLYPAQAVPQSSPAPLASPVPAPAEVAETAVPDPLDVPLDIVRTEPVEVEINSDPTGARVYLDGDLQAWSTPTRVLVRPGDRVQLRVTRQGYKTYNAEITAETGSVFVDFKAPQSGEVNDG